jgi:transcriptional regulator with XRE-family HTH domain
MEGGKQVIQADGGVAVGAYLRFLREAQGLSATEVAERAGTNQSQIWRIDNWKSDTRGTLLFAYIRAVNGDANDIARLINNPKATIEDGETLAKLRLAVLRF